ncbi:WhiB family transcriptional regulator [Rhodococcus opacus]|uniref:WhiB family transcriptional regulator n=1 Tax=Rhodococcus opacus TaxID=37919 RepID=UPI002A59BE29|nr:WhiB family transcriptional regulator [Rhodococcus opacus]
MTRHLICVEGRPASPALRAETRETCPSLIPGVRRRPRPAVFGGDAALSQQKEEPMTFQDGRGFVLRPLTSVWDWQLQAQCRSMDARLFFPDDGVSRTTRKSLERLAKAVCRRCPVQRDCKNHALEAKETYGVWGGTSESERRYLEPAPRRLERRSPAARLRILPRHKPPGRRSAGATTTSHVDHIRTATMRGQSAPHLAPGTGGRTGIDNVRIESAPA